MLLETENPVENNEKELHEKDCIHDKMT